jgi:hypothetical protein
MQTPGTPVASPPPAQGIANIANLRSQLGELNIQARALRATQEGLTGQLERMRLDNPARPGVQQQSADVGTQLARVEGQIAEAQARIAQAQNVSVDRITESGALVPPPMPRNVRRGPDPDMVVGMSFALAMCIALPLSIAYARRLWRGKPQPSAPSSDRLDDVVQRLSRLELGIDSVAIEIERISEGQRFVTKVFADRPAQQAQSAAPDVGRHAGIGDGQPPLRALGAGPVEPIRVNDAEAVKERAR